MQSSESPEGLLKYYCTNEVAFDDSINTQIQPSVRQGVTGVANWRYVNTHPVKIWEKEQESRGVYYLPRFKNLDAPNTCSTPSAPPEPEVGTPPYLCILFRWSWRFVTSVIKANGWHFEKKPDRFLLTVSSLIKLTGINVQGSAKRLRPGFVNAAGKLRQKW